MENRSLPTLVPFQTKIWILLSSGKVKDWFANILDIDDEFALDLAKQTKPFGYKITSNLLNHQ